MSEIVQAVALAISDQHSIEYEFEELSPTVGGVCLDIYISGTAELANDPGYHFYVRSITLDGTMLETFRKPGRLTRDRIKATVTLSRPQADDHSVEAVLFRLIEAAIYEDECALEAWRMEGEAA